MKSTFHRMYICIHYILLKKGKSFSSPVNGGWCPKRIPKLNRPSARDRHRHAKTVIGSLARLAFIAFYE